MSLKVKQLFPHGSESFFQINPDSLPQGAEPESPLQHRSNGKAKREKGNSIRYSVSIVAYRVRECDPDNLCGKYFVDALRYSGLLYNDRAEDITYQISQKKVENKKQEKTLVVIETQQPK